MAGHSKWANIKHRKAAQDKKKGQLFSKLVREIMVAVREGGPDPESNYVLAQAIQRARDNGLPKDKIEESIRRAAGEKEKDHYERLWYEGYGPGGSALMVEALTDNRNRTFPEIRRIFKSHGGSLGETGCVAWQFSPRGSVVIERGEMGEDEILELVVMAEADDFEIGGDIVEIYCEPQLTAKVRQSLEEAGAKVKSSGIIMAAENMVELSDLDEVRKLLRLVDELEDHPDVQNVYTNVDLPEEIMASPEVK